MDLTWEVSRCKLTKFRRVLGRIEKIHLVSRRHQGDLILWKRKQTIERVSIAFTANVRFKLRNFQNEKWADKNSLKQFLRIELVWIYWFSSSYNEQQTTSKSKLGQVVQIHVCRLPLTRWLISPLMTNSTTTEPFEMPYSFLEQGNCSNSIL